MKNESFDIANMPKYGYAVDLSKHISVTHSVIVVLLCLSFA